MTKEKIVKSKKRVKEFGEVYTQTKHINDMLDLLPSSIFLDSTSKFLEPACGNGNFLIEIIKRKMENYNTNMGCKIIYIKKIITNLYGIDIQKDNVDESIERCFNFIISYLNNELKDNELEQIKNEILTILNGNIVIGNSLISNSIKFNEYNWNNNTYTVKQSTI